MPTHFGPSLGPRQGPNGRVFECRDNPKTTSLSVSFLTNREQLEELIPEGFQLEGEPVVTEPYIISICRELKNGDSQRQPTPSLPHPKLLIGSSK